METRENLDKPSAQHNRAEVNRNNAQRSTGPVTEAGKHRSRFNAYRDGLTGRTVVLPWHDHSAYEIHCKELFAGLKPEGALEKQYAQTVADCSWRLNGAAAREANLLSLAIHERAWKIESGDDDVDEAMAEAQALREESQILANISLYCHRLGRQRDKALEQLQALQKARKEQRVTEMPEADRLLNLHKQEKKPFDPGEYGFVFSLAEIDAYIHFETRKDQAWHARAA